jgi:hypothetical protein
MLTALELLQEERDRLLDAKFAALQDRDRAIQRMQEINQKVESLDEAIEVLSAD